LADYVNRDELSHVTNAPAAPTYYCDLGQGKLMNPKIMINQFLKFRIRLKKLQK
jgi:hypothetical protein